MNSKLKKMVEESENIVFFGGAGVSTESGIPDFRSTDGLYNQKYNYPPEVILSHSFFFKNTADFYDFYREKMLYLDAEPNDAHKALAELEKSGKIKAVITQNIDELHQKAGSKNVLELHGCVHRNYCLKCHKFYGVEKIVEGKSGSVPTCDCGGIIKPDVTLYEESLNEEIFDRAVQYIKQAQMLIIGGTSLAVYPAAGLVNYFKGDNLVLINKSTTSMDGNADMIIHDSIGRVLLDLISG